MEDDLNFNIEDYEEDLKGFVAPDHRSQGFDDANKRSKWLQMQLVSLLDHPTIRVNREKLLNDEFNNDLRQWRATRQVTVDVTNDGWPGVIHFYVPMSFIRGLRQLLDSDMWQI